MWRIFVEAVDLLGTHGWGPGWHYGYRTLYAVLADAADRVAYDITRQRRRDPRDPVQLGWALRDQALAVVGPAGVGEAIAVLSALAERRCVCAPAVTS